MKANRRNILCGLAALLFVLTSGCTPYGQNNSSELTRIQLASLSGQLQDSYVRSHAALDRLERADSQIPALNSLVDRYRTLLAMHADLVKAAERSDSLLSSSSDYRTLTRNLRSVVSRRDIINNGYDAIGMDLALMVPGFQRLNPSASDAVSILIPPFYRAIQSTGDRISVLDGLRMIDQ